MQRAQIDQTYFNEYWDFIEVGATACEALIEVANANEVSVIEVFDALVRQSYHTRGINREFLGSDV